MIRNITTLLFATLAALVLASGNAYAGHHEAENPTKREQHDHGKHKEHEKKSEHAKGDDHSEHKDHGDHGKKLEAKEDAK